MQLVVIPLLGLLNPHKIDLNNLKKLIIDAINFF